MSLTNEDAFRIVRDNIRNTPGSKLALANVSDPASQIGGLVALMSAGAQEVAGQSDARFAQRLVGAATGADLDADIADATFGLLPRKGASPAVTSALITRTDTSTDATLPAGTVIAAGPVTFTTDMALPFPKGQGPTGFPVNLTCTTAGPSGNGLSDLSFKAPGSLEDPTFAIASLGASCGGALAENDTSYAARFAVYSVGQGEDGARLSSAALAVPGVSYALMVEETDYFGNLTGAVTIYVADGGGNSNAALVARVQPAIRKRRAPGQIVKAASATPVPVTVVLHVAVLSTASPPAVLANVSAAVVAYVSALIPGQILVVGALSEAIAAVDGVVLENKPIQLTFPPDPVTYALPPYPLGIVSPAADLVPPPGSFFRIDASGISFA